jgi:hypothetical protein
MVFLDVQKAFDSVWHEELLHKLVISNCYLYLTKIIASFLSGRFFHVSVNKTDSATHPISYGIPQGAILSPSLYNFFTSRQSNESETATFVDDTAIFVSSRDLRVVCDILQRYIDSLSTYLKQWKIKINSAKTQAIYFTRCWSSRKLPTAHIRPSYPMVHRSKISWGYPRQETHIRRSHAQVYRENGESLSYIIFIFQ